MTKYMLDLSQLEIVWSNLSLKTAQRTEKVRSPKMNGVLAQVHYSEKTCFGESEMVVS